MTCRICRKDSETGLCPRCRPRVTAMLENLITFWTAAHAELKPGNGGHGSSSGERTLGINVQALSFIAGDDILKTLHSWESIIRTERRLTPPALIAKKPVGVEVYEAVRFAQSHLEWSATQEWIGDYVDEIRDLEKMGSSAAREYVEKAKRISCPADGEDGNACATIIRLHSGDEVVSCPKCGTAWNTVRLIAVALSDEQNEIWLDAEAIGEFIGITPKAIYTLAKRHSIPKRGQLFDLKKILATRKAT